MRKLFKSKIFVFGFILAILSVGIMIYAFVSPSPTPITNLMGAIVTPLEKGVSWVGDGIGGFFAYFKGYDDLERENARLLARISEYEKLESEYYAAVSENEELRRLAGLKQRRSDFEFEMCSVVSTVTNGYTSTFTINRGSLDGIETGDCVMTDAGFVGYISSVSLRSAEVITLINIETKLACIVSRTREAVVVEGDFVLASDGCVKMPPLKNTADVQVGDIIETSGKTEQFPKGVIVGTVKEVRREEHGISSYAIIEPAVDIDKLHTVFVVKDFEITE